MRKPARINIYVPPDLKLRMEARPLDWSRIAQQAFRAAIDAEGVRERYEARRKAEMEAEYGPRTDPEPAQTRRAKGRVG